MSEPNISTPVEDGGEQASPPPRGDEKSWTGEFEQWNNDSISGALIERIHDLLRAVSGIESHLRQRLEAAESRANRLRTELNLALAENNDLQIALHTVARHSPPATTDDE